MEVFYILLNLDRALTRFWDTYSYYEDLFAADAKKLTGVNVAAKAYRAVSISVNLHDGTMLMLNRDWCRLYDLAQIDRRKFMNFTVCSGLIRILSIAARKLCRQVDLLWS